MSDLSIEPLIAVRREPRLSPPPSQTRRLSQAEAYAVRDRLREALIARGARFV